MSEPPRGEDAAAEAIAPEAAASALNHATVPAADAPPIYQYFAILDGDKLHQVVRQSATPDGYVLDEHLARDGSWTRSFLLTEIRIGKSDRDYRLLTLGEVTAPHRSHPCPLTEGVRRLVGLRRPSTASGADGVSRRADLSA